MRSCGGLLAAFVAIFLVLKCTSSFEGSDEPLSNLADLAGASKIYPGAADPWKPEDYPQTVERIGLPAFERGVRLFPRIGKAVASEAECDFVYHVGISSSATPNDVHFFADCENGHRRRFTESEAAALPE